MLMVTENAKRHLKRLLTTHASSHNLGLRLRIGTGMQMGVVLDRKANDDYIVEYEGEEVLMVSPELLPLVDGATLDTDGSGASLFITKKGERQGKIHLSGFLRKEGEHDGDR